MLLYTHIYMILTVFLSLWTLAWMPKTWSMTFLSTDFVESILHFREFPINFDRVVWHGKIWIGSIALAKSLVLLK